MTISQEKMPIKCAEISRKLTFSSKKLHIAPIFISVMKLTAFLLQRNLDLATSGMVAAATIDGSPTTYGLTAANATQIVTTMTAFDNANSVADAAELAYREAVTARNTAREAAVAAFGKWLRLAYANPVVLDSSFAAIGLDARDAGPTPRPVTVPLNLEAVPNQDGTVKLKWRRNGNTSSTTFSLEAMVEDSAWEIVGATNLAKIELTNYAPGTQVTFRVQAIKGADFSDYSNLVTIYMEGGSSLRLAA